MVVHYVCWCQDKQVLIRPGNCPGIVLIEKYLKTFLLYVYHHCLLWIKSINLFNTVHLGNRLLLEDRLSIV